jgi:Protein of unknown function (DUF3742)
VSLLRAFDPVNPGAVMNTPTDDSHAERVSRWFGLAWRGLVRQEVRAANWMVDHGMPRRGARSLLWMVKAIVLVAFLYVAVLLAVVFAVVLLAAKVAKTTKSTRLLEPDPEPRFDENIGRPPWEAGEPTDHRQQLFYHPSSYNDDPDPRFYDPRFHDK